MHISLLAKKRSLVALAESPKFILPVSVHGILSFVAMALPNPCSPCSWREIKLFRPTHLVDSELEGAQILAGYILMLITMTFSMWLLITVVVGSALGYWFFEGISPLVLPTRRVRRHASAATATVTGAAATGTEHLPHPLA